MKTRFLKSFTIEHKQRYGVALLLCVCLLLVALAPGAAQVRTPRRVTGLQLDGAAEGSKVTIVSDVALNDYEAFRSGNRFYVKIPLADITSAVPHLRAEGFEDVQVQKVGDGLIVSFKLQPGATARVDQRGNRLDVVFTSANRAASLNSTRNSGAQGSSDRGRDAAGPIPADTVPDARDRYATGATISGSEQSAGRNPWSPSNSGRNSKGGQLNPVTGNNPLASPSPVLSPSSSPSSILTPGTLSTNSPSYSASPSSTPAASPALAPGAGSSGMMQNWKQRGRAAAQWAASNRLATLLGLLILLSLIIYLLLALRGRREKAGKVKQAKTPKVQPKYSAGSELNERPSPSGPAATEVKKEVAASAARGGQSVAANTSAAAASAAHGERSVLTKPTIATPNAVPDEHREEEEREVFEL